MQNRAHGGQGVFSVQQALHGRAHQNESNLRHGGTGQRPFQVDGEHRQHCAQHHGDHRQRQQNVIPDHIVPEQLPAENQRAENAALGQNTGQQRRRRSRGHRMGFRQPDVQGKHTRLSTEARQTQSACSIEHSIGRGRQFGNHRPQFPDGQGTQQMIQQHQAGQQRHTARHRNGQVGICRPQGFRGLVLCHPYIGGKRHNLKKYVQCEQVSR